MDIISNFVNMMTTSAAAASHVSSHIPLGDIQNS